MSAFRYEYSGLRVIADFALPEWGGFEAATPWTEPDVRLALEDSELSPDAASEQQVRVSPDEASLLTPGVGQVWARAGKELRVRRAPGADMREVRAYVLGFGWGVLCHQRGLMPLHASVVELGGAAIALGGPSGSGKSSAAAWLMAKGHPLVSDDLCLCEPAAQGGPRVWPSAGRLKLWRDALDAQGWPAEGLERDYARADKFHVAARLRSDRAPKRLAAIYLLEWGEFAITRLRGAVALRRLAAAVAYRGELLEGMGRLASYWDQCATLAQGTPIWVFTRPRDWQCAEAAMQRLIAHCDAEHSPQT